MMARTIQETIDHLHSSLKEYIEATYHIGDPALIDQRRTLLERTGVTRQEPFLESTPKYMLGSPFNEVEGLPPAALAVFEQLSKVKERILSRWPTSRMACRLTMSFKRIVFRIAFRKGKT